MITNYEIWLGMRKVQHSPLDQIEDLMKMIPFNIDNMPSLKYPG